MITVTLLKNRVDRLCFVLFVFSRSIILLSTIFCTLRLQRIYLYEWYLNLTESHGLQVFINTFFSDGSLSSVPFMFVLYHV